MEDQKILRHCNAVYDQNTIVRWTKGCIFPFLKKCNFGLVKNYRGITLISIAAKIYNALLRNRIEPNTEKILWKNQNVVGRNRSTTSQILTNRRIEGVRAKNQQVTILFVEFSKDFDSIHSGKMEQILLSYGVPMEMMLYKNTELKVHTLDGDIDYFDIVADVLQRDTLAQYLFTICQDYVLMTAIDKMKDNGFQLINERSSRYPIQTITDADYADDIAVLAKHPPEPKTCSIV